MNTKLIKKIEKYAELSLKNDKTGHDFNHTKRVLKYALEIAENYTGADKEVLILACLLHDIAYKEGIIKNHHLIGAEQAKKILEENNFPEHKTRKIVLAIEDHVGHMVKPVRKNEELQIESKILRDADNINALGEIGLKRQIAFSKKQNVPDFISKDDKLNQSLYGSLKFFLNWPEKMLTQEAKNISKDKIKPIKDYIKKLENKNKK